MRPLESLLLAFEAAALLALVVPRFRAWPLTRLLAIAVLLAAVAQVGLEGARWQMVPAYALSVALCMAALIPRSGASSRLRRLAGVVAKGLGALALTLSLFLSLAFPVFSLPRLDGPYAVGTLTYDWVDAARPEIFQADPRVPRELMVQIWYPARPSQSTQRAPYVPDGEVLAPLARLLHLPPFIFQHLRYVKTDAVPAAPAAPGDRFPVLVFSHGRGGFRQHNTAQIEELVSHGYVVAAIDHTYAAAGVIFADGRRIGLDPRMLVRRTEDSFIPYLAQDVSFVLDQLAAIDRSDPNGVLTGRLNLQRAGMFGLSLGGEVGAEACRVDPRLRACLMMDVWMPADVVKSGLRQPAMLITRDAATMRLEGWTQANIDETLTTMRQVFKESPADGFFVSIPGMFHEEFSDAPLMTPFAPLLGVSGPMDARRGQVIVSAYELAFFDRYLKGTSQPLLAGPSARFPDVLFLSRRR